MFIAMFRRPFWAILAFVAVIAPLSNCGRESPPPVDKLELLEMLRQEQYERLDARLSRYQKAFQARLISDMDVSYAFEAFASADPELESRFDGWVRTAPKSPFAVLARGFYYLHLGEIFLGDGFKRYTRAPARQKTRDFFTLSAVDSLRAIQLEPTLGVAYAVVIRLLILQDDKDRKNAGKIDRYLERGLEAVPRSLAIRAAYAEGLERFAEKPVDAIEEFLDSTARSLPAGQSLGALAGYANFSRAESFRKAQRQGEAIRYYDLALESADFRPYRLAKALNYHELGLSRKSLVELDRILETWPHEPLVLLARARQLAKAGQDDKALLDLDRALQLEPFHPTLLMQQAAIFQRHDRIPEAIRALKFARIYGLFDAKMLYQRGMLLVSQENYAEGLEDLHGARSYDPVEPKYRLAYAEALMRSPLARNQQCHPLYEFALYLNNCETYGTCSGADLMKAEGLIAKQERKFPHCNSKTNR